MAAYKRHFVRHPWAVGRPYPVTVCGLRDAMRITPARDRVTCERCLIVLQGQKEPV
jgi:hypothetical protein